MRSNRSTQCLAGRVDAILLFLGCQSLSTAVHPALHSPKLALGEGSTELDKPILIDPESLVLCAPLDDRGAMLSWHRSEEIELLLQLNDTEEDHAYWLEQQLGLIERIGLQNYLQSQA